MVKFFATPPMQYHVGNKSVLQFINQDLAKFNYDQVERDILMNEDQRRFIAEKIIDALQHDNIIQLDQIETLSIGADGIVYLASGHNNQKLIIKAILQEDANFDIYSYQINQFSQEIQINHKLLNTPNSTHLIKIINSEPYCFFVFEYLTNTNLQAFAEQKNNLQHINTITKQLINLLTSLHQQQQVIHCDLKPSNAIYCEIQQTLQFIDFGRSISLDKVNENISNNDAQAIRWFDNNYHQSCGIYFIQQKNLDQVRNQLIDISLKNECISALITLLWVFKGEVPYKFTNGQTRQQKQNFIIAQQISMLGGALLEPFFMKYELGFESYFLQRDQQQNGGYSEEQSLLSLQYGFQNLIFRQNLVETLNNNQDTIQPNFNLLQQFQQQLNDDARVLVQWLINHIKN